MSVSIFGYDNDIYFMQQALKQAAYAAQENEVPIGAVVVTAYKIVIGSGYNRVEKMQCQIGHAEVEAIRAATAHVNSWRLSDCWLYVTLEPCAMCMGLIRLSRLKGVVYAAPSPLFGFRLDNTNHCQVYKEDTLIIINNVLKEEATMLLKNFFQKKRNCKSE